MIKISPSEITPEHIFLSRRKFMVGAGSLAAGALALSACAGMPAAGGETAASAPVEGVRRLDAAMVPEIMANAEPTAGATADELGDPLNDYEQITNYNNFYEFSLDKEAVNPQSRNFNTLPWTIELAGLVNQPQTIAIEDVLKQFTQEERIYRLRCVEAWSMVVPWIGFPVGELIKLADPKAEAKFVQFTTVLRPEEMPGQKGGVIEYPYIEGLRLDEAMHPLAIFATGMYGKPLEPANGAPIRLVVPWKYGFKSIKSIVKIELTDTMPVSTWMKAAANEYGFYANVNPEVNHPRWSQATERRIGEFGRRDTLKFNGYEEEVASLYSDMDLRENF